MSAAIFYTKANNFAVVSFGINEVQETGRLMGDACEGLHPFALSH